jgi:hypothetical protein
VVVLLEAKHSTDVDNGMCSSETGIERKLFRGIDVLCGIATCFGANNSGVSMYFTLGLQGK